MPNIKKGDIVEARSGSQGWVKGIVVDEADIFAETVGGIMTQGQRGFMVRFTEGKHAGEVIKLPDNYLRLASVKYHEYRGYSGEYDAQGNRRMGPMRPDSISKTKTTSRLTAAQRFIREQHKR